WNIQTGEELFTLSGHSDGVLAVGVTADGKRVISGSEDHTVKVWNLNTREELFTLYGHTSLVRAVAVTADNQRAISVSEDHTVKVWNLETEEIIATFIGNYPFYSCAVSYDGLKIITGNFLGAMHFLKLENVGE
ncbi:MAG: hypothetical protein F6K62_20125, partial [Sphaerospermopsis sp. SIO1G2]|nr:hypothetical protein [Sphaerospermopsis sp. SIO1G2]